MSAGESPAADGPSGMPVDEHEDLFRAILYPGWWAESEQRISSVAFSFPRFSVDVASLAGSPDAILSRFLPGTGLVVFPCRAARQLGCDVRLEPDAQDPENRAHAHVYMPTAKRKTIARTLVDATTVIRKPHFAQAP